MIRRLVPLALVALLLLPMASFATAQTSGGPIVSMTSQYMVNEFGFAVVNETVVFQNNGTSTLQIPSVQVGIPDSVASHSAGWVLVSQQQFTQTSSNNGDLTTFTIVPSSPSLAAGASATVSLKSFLSGIFNITSPSSGPFNATFLLRPSVNVEVASLDSEVLIPTGGSVSPTLAGYTEESAPVGVIYSNTTKDLTPSVMAASESFSDSSQTSWLPLQVYSVVTTIVPSANAQPQVEQYVGLRNLANYSVSDLPLTLFATGLSQVMAVPATGTPTINPVPVNLTSGAVDVAGAPWGNAIQPGDNFTFGIEYSLPKSYAVVSGTSVTVSLPYTLPIQALVQNYTVRLAPASGITPVGASSSHVYGATPLGQGSLSIKYDVNLGWGASQAVPIASLVFAVAFVALGFSRRSKAAEKQEEEEEVDELSQRLSDMIKAYEEKIALFQQFETDMEKKSQGSVSRADFNKVRNEMDSLRAKASSRLNALRQTAGSQKNVDLLNQVQEASREEDRAAKDLLNLYDQYQSRRMKEETYRRLLSNYRRRSDSAVNHLSDLLNMAQREGKQG